MKYLLLFSLLSFKAYNFAQKDSIVFAANVLNSQFEGVSFANIYVKNRKNVFTVSDEKGYFSIACKQADTLILKKAAYETIILPLKLILENDTFNLHRNLILKHRIKTFEVVNVVGKQTKIKHRNYGAKSEDRVGMLGIESGNEGNEFGLKINIPETKNVKLERFKCYIGSNSFDSIKFKLDIYSFEEKDSSFNLIEKTIFSTFKKKKGSMTIDLSEEQIYLKDDILVTLEVYEIYGKGSLYFSSSVVKGGTYFRNGKAELWEKFPIVGIAFNIDCRLF